MNLCEIKRNLEKSETEKVVEVINAATRILSDRIGGMKIEPIAENIEYNGLELQKVNRKAREGDYVRFHKLTTEDTTNGKLYEVRRGVRYIDNKGNPYRVHGWQGCPNPEIYEVIGNIGYIHHVSNDAEAVYKACECNGR